MVIYITISTFTSIRPSSECLSGTFTLPIPSFVLQNVIGKSCLVCVESEKYAFLVYHSQTLRSMMQGETKLRTLHYYTR